jgi:hypothetical protein
MTLRVRLLLLAVSLGAVVGCGGPRMLPDGYGRRGGGNYGNSVNGTAVLARMFEARGHRVNSWRTLSPTIENAEVIVWFPDKFEPPEEATVERLKEWLDTPGRTLVYVGRDFDAAPGYFKKIIPKESPSKQIDLRKVEKLHQSDISSNRSAAKSEGTCEWFDWKRDVPVGTITPLGGPLSNGIDGTRVELELQGRLRPKGDFKPLLTTAGEPFVSRLDAGSDGDSTIILVQNGSFLLNLPLVNHEHRKLADRLIDEVQATSGEAPVIFLESGSGGPEIRYEDKFTMPPSPTNEPPLVYAWQHAVAMGVLFLFASWPIFGRPRRLRPRSTSNFGRHIDALGDLLSKTSDDRYFRERLETWRAEK